MSTLIKSLMYVPVFVYRNSIASATTWHWSSLSPPKQRREEEQNIYPLPVCLTLCSPSVVAVL